MSLINLPEDLVVIIWDYVCVFPLEIEENRKYYHKVASYLSLYHISICNDKYPSKILYYCDDCKIWTAGNKVNCCQYYPLCGNFTIYCKRCENEDDDYFYKGNVLCRNGENMTKKHPKLGNNVVMITPRKSDFLKYLAMRQNRNKAKKVNRWLNRQKIRHNNNLTKYEKENIIF
jgi:hypothetical protein